MLFPPGHFVFLDLETTGVKASMDRITEVALIEVLDGEVIDQYQTLVNPQVPISSFITSLTGIDDMMAAKAPPFADIAEDLLSRILGRTLVAHNARFDHSFLKNEFRRVGLDYRGKVLCTVKLSRSLMPEVKSHSLDNLINLHGLHVENRHRAMGDTDLLVQLMARWCRLFGVEAVAAQLKRLLKTTSLPAGLRAEDIARLPQGPGVYLFYDERDALLYVGKSVNIQERVRSHFNSDHTSDKELQLSQQVRRVDYQLTGGDLGAQLLEARLIKHLQPLYNRQLRKTRNLWYWELSTDAAGYRRVQVRGSQSLPVANLDQLVGLFRSKKMAETRLREMVETAQLCHRLTGLEKSRQGACFAFQLHRCAGACTALEPADAYNQRLEQVLAQWRFKVWPAEGPLVVREASEETLEYHLVDNWCYLGSAPDESSLSPAATVPEFDYDTYKILLNFIGKRRSGVSVYPYQGRHPGRQLGTSWNGAGDGE